MPIIKGAIKKQRVDKGRTKVNAVIRAKVKSAVRKAEKSKEPLILSQLSSVLDRAVAKKQLTLNKASRIKSRLMKASKLK